MNAEHILKCRRSLQNQPAGVESKPATPRCLIHISFLDTSKGLFNFFISAGSAKVKYKEYKESYNQPDDERCSANKQYLRWDPNPVESCHVAMNQNLPIGSVHG